MIRRTLIASLFAAAVTVVTSAGSANAGLLPVSVTVQPEAGNFRWTYSVVLPTDMKLQSGNYFTIYDFAGYQAGSGTVSSTSPDPSFAAFWSLSTAPLGPTPALLNPTDNPLIDNLTFTYNGPVIPQGQLTLGNFAATSLFSATTPSFFSAITSTAATGVVDSNVTETLSPQFSVPPPIGTPEPTTLALAGLGLPLIGLSRYVRRKGKAIAA